MKIKLLSRTYAFFIFLLLLLFVNVKGNAQVDPVGNFNRHVFETWNGDYIRIGQYRVKGSPYFMGTSYNGVLHFTNGNFVNNKKILFNLYTQKVGADVKNELFELDEPVSEFNLQIPIEESTKILNFKNGTIFYGQKVPSFYNVLAEGKKISFLKQFKINLKPDLSNEMEKDKKMFEQYFDYYIYLQDVKELRKIKLNKKDILKVIGNDEKLMAYLKENDVEFSKEKNVMDIVNYINSY